MTTATITTKCKSRGALERAFVCAILSEAPTISLHTRMALRSIARRLLIGQAVSWDEYSRATYGYFSTRD